jgi:hypothetical protein
MKMNVGATDKWIRIILGLALLSLLFILPGSWRWFGLAGLVLIVTGILNFCPLYALFGISTRKNK